jgi:hypothetical protein
MYTFYELKRGSELELFYYKVDENETRIENEKHYPVKVRSIIDKFKAISPALVNTRKSPAFPKTKEGLHLRGGVNFENIEIWKEKKSFECEDAHEKEKIFNTQPTKEQLSERVTDGIWLNIPPSPNKLKADLEIELARYTNDDNIRIVIEALFGTTTLPKKNGLQKLSKMIAQQFKIEDNNIEDFVWIPEDHHKG